MVEPKKSFLTDPQFLAEASAGNILNDMLNDPGFITKAIVSDRRDNDFSANNTFIQDLKSMSYYDLGKKYGAEVRDNRGKWQEEVERQQRILNTERDIGQKVGDFTLSAGSAVTSLVGGLSSAILAIGGVADELYDPTLTGLSEEAAKVAIATGQVSTWIHSFQSKKLADRAALGAVATELDDAESALQLEEDLAEGRNKYIAGLMRMGRDALSAGERIMEDGALASDVIAQGLGSILGSGKVAGAGAKLFGEAAAKIGGGRVAQSIARAAGSSSGIGLTEASGVFTQAAEEVMNMTEEQLMGSPVYVAFRDRGMDHNEAQLNTSNSVAREAGIRQLPAAMSAGLLAHRFNANPLKAFKGKSFIGGVTEMGKQTLEEGFQGGSGAYNVNVAIQNQVDADRSLTQGVGGEVTTGAFAGFGIAGTLSAPHVARGTLRGAAVGTIAAADLIAQGVRKVADSEAATVFGEKAADALDATVKGAKVVAKKIEPVTKPIAKVVKKGAKAVDKAVVKPAMQKVEDFNEKPNVKLQLEVLEASGKAVDAAPDNEVIKAVDKLIMDLAQTQASKMTDEAVLEAANNIIALRKEVPKLEDDVAVDVLRMLSSSEFLKIQTRYHAIKKKATDVAPDLNKTQTSDTAVTQETIKETLEVAALDPAKVNSDHIGKILKSEDHGLSDDQVVLLEIAAAVSRLVDTHRGERIKVSARKSVTLSKRPAYANKDAPEVLDIETVSRSIQVGGFTDARGKDLRSINDFVADFIAARQGKGIVVDTSQDEGSISADTLAKNFGMFVEHLRNKVEALNKSIAQGGTTFQFRSIVGGDRMVNAGVAGGAQGVFYHANNAESVATAEGVANDAKIAAEAYNILVRAFPDAFPGGEVNIPSLNTTAVEDVEATTGTETQAKPKAKEPGVTETDEQTKKEEISPSKKALILIQTKLRRLLQEVAFIAEKNPKDTRLPSLTKKIIELRKDKLLAEHVFDKTRDTTAIDETTKIPLETSTKEEDEARLKLSDELRILKNKKDILRKEKDDAVDKGLQPFDLDPFFDRIDANKAAIKAKEDEITALHETQREARKTTAVDETISPQAQIDEEAETQTKEEDDGKARKEEEVVQTKDEAYEADLKALNGQNVGTFTPATDKQVNGVRGVITYVAGLLGVDLNQDIRNIFVMEGKGITGYAFWAQGVIGFSKTVFGRDDNRNTAHVITHELAHMWDFKMGDGTVLKSVIDGLFSSGKKGELYLEILAKIANEPELKLYFQYALNFSNDNVKSQELFAELVAMYLMNPEFAQKHFPKGIEYVEALIEDHADADFVASREDSGSETQDESAAPSLDTPPTEKFSETFVAVKKVDGDLEYNDGNELLDLLDEETTTEGYMKFAKEIFQTLIDGMNARLATTLVSKKDGRTLKQAILDGKDLTHIRDFKNTMLVDPKTGEYNPELLSIAVVAMIDWLSSVRSADPHSKQLKKTLDLLGVNIHDLNSEDFHNIVNGVSPRFVSETLHKRIIKMWKQRIQKKGQMVDARGAVEGLVKEMLEVLSDKTNYIQLHEIPTKFTVKKAGKTTVVTTPTINVKGLIKIQKEIGLSGRDSVQRLLSPEEDIGPSIGKRIDHVAKKNRRNTVNLSKKERRALRAEQDVPHLLAKGISGLISFMGFDIYGKMLGHQSVDHLSENHPLRNSIEGKNLSIVRDWDDAHAVTAELQGDQQDTPVYFRITITKAGRHQHSGINAQNNKTLRVMISPTNATLDMTKQDDIDGFWLTVAQASGLFKVENVKHEKILAEIQGEFAEKYGEAQKLIENYLNTGKIDGDALFEATGEITMEILNSIFAVADLANVSRKTNALTEFFTTLGFELDGKTDGPAHMMNNFGQGLLSPEDYKNFKRVGMFLGTVKETLNSFFSNEDNKDLYNEASVKGQNKMYSEMANADPAMQASLFASARFAERFGDFRLGDDGLPEMTRDTLKNPMTKTVYGSGLFSVARGIAEDMVMGFYRKAVHMPKGADPATYFGYPSFEADFELLFGYRYPKDIIWNKNFISKAAMAGFTDIIVAGIGEMIANSAKEVIGAPITKVADLLVFITNVQTEFMKLIYDRNLKTMAETRAKEGKIGRSWKKGDPEDRSANTGPGIERQLTVEDFQELKASVEIYGPVYDNGDQKLALGAFSPQPSQQRMSSTIKGDLDMKSNMDQPEDARVKVIPYLTQGRGDAMVVNTIFGGTNPPEDVMAVHDGYYVPINKIKEYSKLVNKAVMEVWDRDVIGDTVEDFEGFLDKISNEDSALLIIAMKTMRNKPYDTTVTAKTVNSLMQTLKTYHKGNQVRKTVFKVIPLGVDHLGGSELAATRNEEMEEMDRHQINERIADEMKIKRRTRAVSDAEEQNADQEFLANERARAVVAMNEAMDADAERDNTQITLPKIDKNADRNGKSDVPSSIMLTDTQTILERLKLSSNRLTIKRAVELLDVFMRRDNYKVVFAGLSMDLIEYYDQVHGEGAAEKQGITIKNMPRGWIDVDTKTIWTVSQNHEVLVHEMIHLVTYGKMVAHYDGTQTNDAVTRLETLMEEFMEIDYSDKGPSLKKAVNAAKAAILLHQVGTTSANKAAALNEFIAWTLSNAALTKDLKTRDTALVRMAKKVVVLIKRILGDKIPSDMYSHILFNTVLLDDAWIREVQNLDTQNFDDIREQNKKNELVDLLNPDDPSLTSAVGDGGDINGVDKDNGDGDDGGRGNEGGDVTPPAAQRTNFWIDLIRHKLKDLKTDPDRVAATARFKRYQKDAINAMKALDFGGFVMDEYQKHTFRAIHMVLATEMRLNTQSSTALNRMFEHITTNLKPEMFGKGKQGQELYATVMDLLGNTKNVEGVSDAMAILLALSQTSNVFRAALDELPSPSVDQFSDGSLNGFLTSITGILMNKALGTINIADSGAKELLDTLALNLIRQDSEREYTLLRALMGSLDKADKFVGGALNELAERAARANQGMKETDRLALTKLVVSTFAASTAFLSADRSAALAEGAKRITHMGVALDHAVFLREFVTEVVGADGTNAEVIMMLDRTNYAVQAIRQDFKEQLPVILQNAFEKHPDEAEWQSFHRVIASLDFAHLFDVENPDRAFDLMKDASLLSSKTVDAETVITSHFNKTTSENILEKAKQLAGAMNHKGNGQQLLQNAYAINKLAGRYDKKMTGAIDTLISLYALEIADQAQKDTIVRMYKADPKAMQNLVTYIQALNKEEDEKEFSEGARMQGRKGWIPDHGKKNAIVVIERDDKGDQLIKMGYTRVGDALADRKFSTVKRGYYATTVKQGTAYSQGVLQSVQGTYRGVNSVTGISVAPNVSGVITGAGLKAITAHMNANKITNDKEVLNPVHDENGEIWAYERIINPEIMAKYSKPKSNLALMLGAWAGRQVEEKMASQYNFELIIELKRIYDERKSNDDKLYVDISDPDIKDPIYRDSWQVISPETRKQIDVVFQGKGFFIRKDMVNLSLGYSDPTIVDVWTGKTRMPKGVQKVIQAAAKATMGNKAVTILSRGEEGIQGTIAKAKDIIVVRSMIVPYMNTQANVFQLMTRGVPLKAMAKGYRDKSLELEQFNENVKRLMEINTNIALAGKDKNQVAILEAQAQVIKDENLRMSIAPLIEAGQYKNISEGITELDVELTTGRMAEWIENQVNKLPGPLQTITKYGLLSKDTAIYKMANKAVQYGDFLAKAIYYDHLTQVKGLSGEAALKQINEEYVNFSILPGRSRSALEALGATWFLSFKIRTMKVALNVMRENPVRALILMTTGVGEFGSPTNDNLATVILQGRFDYSIGWDMLLGSPELNPWAQLWGWA